MTSGRCQELFPHIRQSFRDSFNFPHKKMVQWFPGHMNRGIINFVFPVNPMFESMEIFFFSFPVELYEWIAKLADSQGRWKLDNPIVWTPELV